MRAIPVCIFAIACALVVPAVYAKPVADPVADAIKAGGVILLMRHATAPGTGDPEQFKADDCSTQRNLSAEGRDEARQMGARLKQLGLVPGEVLTSQWCRCRETAQLAFGAAKDWPALNSFLRKRETEATQKREILTRIARVNAGAKPLVLVTHQVIVTALTGIYPQSGEVIAVAPLRKTANNGGKSDEQSAVRVIGSLRPEAIK